MNVRKQPRDEGAALALAMVLTLIGLIVGSSLMLLSQTETFASANYQAMTQARFAAESGTQKAINFLLNNYTLPGDPSDPITAYNTTVTPVTFSNNPVVLSARTEVPANYPVPATQTAFNAAAQGDLSAGGATLHYTASAQLVAMRLVYTYGSGIPQAVQTWLITGVGTTGGARPATVEVSATFERQAMPFNLYGLFATAVQCGALKFGGGGVTNSYDSSNITWDANGHPQTTANYGNVGTNGNMTEVGNSVINGSLSTPRTGVGVCSSGAIDALTQTGQATVTGGLVQLPQAVTYPTPPAPTPAPPTGNQNVTSSTTCADSGFAAANCSGAAGNLVLDPLGGTVTGADVKLTGGAVLHLKPGTYNFNSISLQGNSQIVVDPGPGAVILQITGTGQTTPIDLSGGTTTNTSYIPKKLQILYGGEANVKVAGGAAASMMVFAPKAAVTLTGGADLYGAVLGKTIDDGGGTSIHYDRDLPTEFYVAWNTMMSGFSWKKY